MKRIIVTGAGGSAAHNFIESLRLAKEKFYIIGTDMSKYHVELSGADRCYQLPRADSDDYLKKLNLLIKKEKIDFVHPQPDPEVTKLSRDFSQVKAKTFLPSSKTIGRCQNKIKFNQIISKIGLETAKSFYLEKEEDLEKAFKNLSKDHEKMWVRAIRGAGSKAALPVTKQEHASGWIKYWIDSKGLQWNDFMISEFLPGREFAFQSIWHKGEILVSQARERLEYFFGSIMPSGQSSTPSVARTVNNKSVNQAAFKAIKAIDPQATGIFCADLKENKEGEPCVMEVNAGRFFTTSNFFSHAGLNMPLFYLKLGLGENVSEFKFKKFNNLEENLYWVRMLDMGYKLIKEGEWQLIKF